MRHPLRRTTTLVAGGLTAAACLLPSLEVDDSLGGQGGASGEGGAATATVTGQGGGVDSGAGGLAAGGETSSSSTTTSPSATTSGAGGDMSAGGSAGGGQGGAEVCRLGTVTCGDDECVDLGFSEAHCGDCGMPCGSGDACLSGECCAEEPLAGGASNLDGCGCPAGEICYPDEPSTGLQCLESDDLGEAEDCQAGVCAQGLGCFNDTCKPYCESGADCTEVDGVAECLPTFWATTQAEIPGVSVCPRVCDSAYPQDPLDELRGCPDNFGCAPHRDGASDCFFQPGLGIPGAACASDAQCTPGRFCDAADGYCRDFCLSNPDCNPQGGTSSTCVFDLGTDPLFAGSFEVGYCTLCTNTCAFDDDGDCDDGGDPSDTFLCTFGTDCADCGPR